MGLAQTSLSIRYAKKAIIDSGIPIFRTNTFDLANGVYRTLLKSTLDVTDVDYLVYSYDNPNGVNDQVCRVKIGAVTLTTKTIGASDREYEALDISSYTGEHTILIEAYCDGGTNGTGEVTFNFQKS